MNLSRPKIIIFEHDNKEWDYDLLRDLGFRGEIMLYHVPFEGIEYGRRWEAVSDRTGETKTYQAVDTNWFDKTFEIYGYDIIVASFNEKQFDPENNNSAAGLTQGRGPTGAYRIVISGDKGEKRVMAPDRKEDEIYGLFLHEVGHVYEAEMGEQFVHQMDYHGGGVVEVWKHIRSKLSEEPDLSGIAKALAEIQSKLDWILNREKLIQAIIQVESSGNDNAIGDLDLPNKAYGPMQIRQPYCDDVNRAFGTTYRAEDCLGRRELSREIFGKYMELWATPKNVGRAVTQEDRARIHNGGPSGWRRSSTRSYWTKVKKHL